MRRTAIIPKHETSKLSVFNEIAKKDMMCACVDGQTLMEAKDVLEKLNIVHYPECPKNIPKQVGEKIKREARRKAKKKFRVKPEHYPIPPWVGKNSAYKKYYLDCLAAEIELRKGYKECLSAR